LAQLDAPESWNPSLIARACVRIFHIWISYGLARIEMFNELAQQARAAGTDPPPIAPAGLARIYWDQHRRAEVALDWAIRFGEA
jgi:hypothetical protein